jgi:hypothetical protein
MSKKTRKIEDLSLDEFLQREYRKVTRTYPTLVAYMIGDAADLSAALKWMDEAAKLDKLYDARPPADEQRAMFSEMELAFVDQDAPIAAYPETDTTREAPSSKAADLLSKYNSAFMYGIGGTFANSPGRRVREAEDAWITQHGAGRDRYEAREAARAAVAMAA